MGAMTTGGEVRSSRERSSLLAMLLRRPSLPTAGGEGRRSLRAAMAAAARRRNLKARPWQVGGGGEERGGHTAEARAARGMFKKFGGREDVSSVGMIKSSQQRAIRRAIEEAYGAAMGGEEVLEQVLPRRATIYLARCKDHITLLCIDNVPLFFQHFDGPFLPTLRTLHRFPTMMAAVRVDQGATKYILQGADIMCPGLTNARGHLPPLLAIGTPVVRPASRPPAHRVAPSCECAQALT